MSTFLYLRGEPGSGKITTARILEKDLGWHLCWFHDLDGVYRIIGEYKVPRLMDEIMQTLVKHLLPTGRSIIYVRPSRDAESVNKVRNLVALYPQYCFRPIRLVASYDTLLDRVQKREGAKYRVQDKAGLDEYLESRPLCEVPNEVVVNTDGFSPQSVADTIKKVLYIKEQVNGRSSARSSDAGRGGGRDDAVGGDREASDCPAGHVPAARSQDQPAVGV